MPSLAEHLNWHVKGWMHRRLTPRVLATPPIRAHDDGVVLFSMIGTKALLPYLVAVKSLHAQLGRGRIAVLDDGSLTEGDRTVLRHHLDGPAITAISAVDTGGAPRGGTWERLLHLLELRSRDYVIQVDSDTIATGPVPEVESAIAAGCDFMLRGEAGVELQSAAVFAGKRADVDPRAPGLHVQDAAEAAMASVRIPALAQPRYARGCSGFAGFAPGGPGRGLAEAFSLEMDRLVGRDRWSRWGSEQVTSNFMVANGRNPLLLPYDRYLNFEDRGVPADAAFVHFIGTRRFHGSAYLDATRAAIRKLAGG